MLDNFYELKRKFTFISTFFLVLVGAIIASTTSLLVVHRSNKAVPLYENYDDFITRGPKIHTAFVSDAPIVSGQVLGADARSELIKDYLKKYESPLHPYAEYIVKVADRYGVDFRLITAIAQQESNLCKKIPSETFNCWGWGIHSKGTLGFSSFQEGIDIVTKGIKDNYLSKGYKTPNEIMSKYTPSSDGSWANGVTAFMQEMQ